MKIIEEIKRYYPTFRNAVYYFGGSIIQMLIGLITSPIFARNLEASDFATIGYFQSLQSIVLPLSTLSLNFFYMMRYFRETDETNNKNFSNILVFLSLSNTVLISLNFFVLFIYFKVAHVSIPLLPYAIIMLSTLFFEVYKSFTLLDFKVKKKALSYFILSASYAVFNVLLGLLFVVYLKGGAAGKMLGTSLTSFIISASVIYIYRRRISLKLDVQLIKNGLKYSFPMLLSAYAYIPLTNIDRLFVERLHNINEMGLYSIGISMASYISIMGSAIGKAFEPDFFRFVISNDRKKFALHSIFYIGSIFIASVLFIIFSKYIISYLTSRRYTEAYRYANLNVIASFIMDIAGITNVIILALQKTKYMLIINLLTGAVALFLYYFLVGTYGFQGGNYSKIAIAVVYLLFQMAFIYFRNCKLFYRLKIN
jgi:O-antigen/teichoic acid export membrane protein